MKFIKTAFLIFLASSPCMAQKMQAGEMERKYCIATLTRIADPVLNALSRNELKKTMPIEAKVSADRAYSTYLEAFGRLIAGMSPWLELGPDNSPEGKLREKYILLVLSGLKNATDPAAADFMNFREGKQPLVDAAFLSQALLRAPKQLWERSDAATKANILAALKSSRVITPSFTNWLMFSATVESAIQKFDGTGDQMRIDYALKQHVQWYKGDGAYGDGPNFHWDYYNSFVIQPMLLNVTTVLKDSKLDTKNYWDLFLARSQRYAAVQERLISPEATYPPIGRSLAYRFGAFQLLSQIALMSKLPEHVSPQQVRFALYSMIKRQIEAPGTFDDRGWLRIGIYGHQPGIGENYISTGSLYLCSEVFLILGLPPADPLWTAADENWTARKVWNGEPIEIDHALLDTEK